MATDPRLEKFYSFLSQPLIFRARFLLAACVLPILLGFAFPLWRVHVEAPQVTDGLTLDVYAHTIDAGHDGRDLRELNVLHHYVGMKEIDRHDLTDLDWLPFALGLLAVITLRCAAVGDVRSLVDLVVVTGYVGLFSMARFALRLREYGRDLSPDAPMKVPPFTPTMFGTQQIGPFTTASHPQLGAAFVALFGVSVTAILAWHLVVGRRAALGARATEASKSEAA